VTTRVATIAIPPIAERGAEIERLLEAYGADAVEELGADFLGFRPHDLERVRTCGVADLDELEELARRLVALRNWGVSGGKRPLPSGLAPQVFESPKQTTTLVTVSSRGAHLAR
jgi:DNA-binding NtrC family response regulator